jgi:hypothetical protein
MLPGVGVAVGVTDGVTVTVGVGQRLGVKVISNDVEGKSVVGVGANVGVGVISVGDGEVVDGGSGVMESSGGIM